MNDVHTLFRLPTVTALGPLATPQAEPVNQAMLEAKRRWAIAAWFGVATYLAWSPLTVVNKLLPAGSSTRGVVLTLVPLVGVFVILKLPTTARNQRVDLLVLLLTSLTIWEAISVEQSAGFSYFLHVFPSVALLTLGVVARSPVDGLSIFDIRTALTSVLAPLSSLLVLGWIAQFAHLVPQVTGAQTQSAFFLSIHGYRLQGLTSSPNILGFLAALTTLVAFVARGSRVSWVTRAVGLLTLMVTDSRTSMVVLGVGLFTLWVLGPGWTTARRVTAFFGLLLAAIVSWQLVDVQRATNTDILSGRDLIWRDLLPYLHHLPILGWGPKFFPELVPLVFGPFAVPGQILDPQNQWLSDSLEFGFVAAILLTGLLVVIPRYGSWTYRRLLLFPLLIAVIVECFSEVPLAIFSSIDGALPLFLLIMWAPLRSPQSSSGGQVMVNFDEFVWSKLSSSRQAARPMDPAHSNGVEHG
jgi:hypothetical protein